MHQIKKRSSNDYWAPIGLLTFFAAAAVFYAWAWIVRGPGYVGL